MKPIMASTLVEVLQRHIERHGDMPVFQFNDPGHSGDDGFLGLTQGCQANTLWLSPDQKYADLYQFDAATSRVCIVLS